jgi:hypothetical protein
MLKFIRSLAVPALLLTYGAPAIRAQDYTFTKIASSLYINQFNDFSLNNNGEVAFLDFPDGSGATGRSGIFVWKDGTAREAVTGQAPYINHPLGLVRINDSGTIGYAEINRTSAFLRVVKNENTSTIASAPGRFTSFRLPPLGLNNQGKLFFAAALSAGGACLCAGQDGEETIGRESDLHSLGSSFTALAVNDTGTVAAVDATVLSSRILIFENGRKTVLGSDGERPTFR